MGIFKIVNIIFRQNFRQFSTKLQEISNIPTTTTCNDLETQLLQVAIIGVPNAGKSTFINNLMDRKVCPTSMKVHTTRAKSRAIFTKGDTQIVFLDTPGLVSMKEQKQYNLEKSFLRDPKSSLKEADIIGVIHDTSNSYTRHVLDIKIIRLLEYYENKPSFLVLNKIDVLKSKRKLLDLTHQLTENCINGKPIPGIKIKQVEADNDIKGWPNFRDIFMVSALTGDGLDEVKNYLIQNAKPNKWIFPEDSWSDQKAEKIIVDSVKAKLLDFLPQEIPYQLKAEMEFFNINSEGIINTVVLVRCPSERIAKFVAGASDGKLRQITQSLQHDLQEAFQCYVRIRLVLDYH